jgi:hypothetical protein
MTQSKPDKMQKRAAALRENLRRRKPKTDKTAEKPAKAAKKTKNDA